MKKKKSTEFKITYIVIRLAVLQIFTYRNNPNDKTKSKFKARSTQTPSLKSTMEQDCATQ